MNFSWKEALEDQSYAVFDWGGSDLDLIAHLTSAGLSNVPTTQGMISDNVDFADEYDWNKTGRAFYFHQDGSHLIPRPSYVALFCINPGMGAIHTVLTDAREVYKSLLAEFDSAFLDSLQALYIDKHNKLYRRPLVEEYNRIKYINTFHYLEPELGKLRNAFRMHLNELLGSLLTAIKRSQQEHVVYEHGWRRGEVLLFQNQYFHHARENASGVEDKDRHLKRMWFDAIKGT